MVRVISVHNFPRQDVSSVIDVTAAAVARSNILLVGQSSHNIAIRSDGSQERFLPTVDEPISIQYSDRGNYIATLEARGDVKFVRVYLGWEDAESATPLRARIAGIVSPLSQIMPGVEMLEVPTPAMPECIAVCPFSGNLLVGCSNKICVFKYIVQQHDISKFDFVDFFKTKWDIHLGFTPTNIAVCENIVAAHNESYLVVVKIVNRPISGTGDENKPVQAKISGPIDYHRLTESPALYDVDFRTHVFPSVAAEPEIDNTPFIPYSRPPVKLTFESPAKVENVNVVTLIQLQLGDCVISSSGRRDLTETFVCIKLTPYFLNSVEKSSTPETAPLCGPTFHNLQAISCFFGTQQEGYLYHYLCQTQKFVLASVYPFTGPLHDVAVDDALLHALTDAGLETYTLRVPSSPAVVGEKDPICLVGLRPFLHVRRMLLGSQSLFLLASQDPGTPWTIYNLTLAETGALWGDFLTAAEENRWEAPSTYAHLVKEVNLILVTRRERHHLMKREKPIVNEEKFVLVDNLYKQSCAILADHYILHDEVDGSFEMYRKSELKLSEIVRRIQSLLHDVPIDYRSRIDESTLNARMMLYVKEALRLEDLRYNSYGDNREEFYTPDVSGFVSTVLDVIEKHDKKSVSTVILSSSVILQFGSDKSLAIVNAIADPEPADLLALSVIHLQKGNIDRGHSILASLDHSTLEPLLMKNCHLLWESETSPTELTLTLLRLNPKFLAGLLSVCVENDVVAFERVHKTFTHLLQNGGLQSKNAADVFEAVIEDQLEIWQDKRHLSTGTLAEAINSLSCLYLTRLSQRRPAQSDRVLCKEARPRYLDHLPPFAPDFSHVLSPQHSPNLDENDPKDVLIKLQSLLGSDMARGCLYKVRLLLWQTPKVFGCLSLHVQCAAPDEAAQMLVNFAPHALLSYLKECQIDELGWSNLIEQIQYKLSSSTDSKRKFYYEQLLHNLLEHMTQKLPLKTVAELVPSECPQKNHLLRLAYNHEQAQQVRSLIMLTGEQLL